MLRIISPKISTSTPLTCTDITHDYAIVSLLPEYVNHINFYVEEECYHICAILCCIYYFDCLRLSKAVEGRESPVVVEHHSSHYEA